MPRPLSHSAASHMAGVTPSEAFLDGLAVLAATAPVVEPLGHGGGAARAALEYGGQPGDGRLPARHEVDNHGRQGRWQAERLQELVLGAHCRHRGRKRKEPADKRDAGDIASSRLVRGPRERGVAVAVLRHREGERIPSRFQALEGQIPSAPADQLEEGLRRDVVATLGWNDGRGPLDLRRDVLAALGRSAGQWPVGSFCQAHRVAPLKRQASVRDRQHVPGRGHAAAVVVGAAAPRHVVPGGVAAGVVHERPRCVAPVVGVPKREGRLHARGTQLATPSRSRRKWAPAGSGQPRIRTA
mmetsp:Transcript_17018/g.46853  ORF Transcript_17018/g.46853 Transcript_17018/m.46853 type:complete len:299 (+) Transcript_17018:500-1396(+)